ncbi:protein of unknown function (plasmid) [Caballeronia sp. S22]
MQSSDHMRRSERRPEDTSSLAARAGEKYRLSGQSPAGSATERGEEGHGPETSSGSCTGQST